MEMEMAMTADGAAAAAFRRAVAATLAVVADSDVVVRGTSIAEAWWSCGSDVKIENDGGAAIECARCRDGRGWMHDGTAQVALAGARGGCRSARCDVMAGRGGGVSWEWSATRWCCGGAVAWLRTKMVGKKASMVADGDGGGCCRGGWKGN
ncbi:hypothetical protein DEO72_LG3g1381 [Vigna unguiculata]|uniref:Uncharacterized protein n=1 Tax=Vigna unguiculata TaxID=3917 RepID=A0A4D6LED7_VIGUN|nr:hypothetical protein DEO72_LG3g1381 [Vigna unguiculata]